MSKEYPGLLHCYRCGGHYTAGQWMLVEYEQGTSGSYRVDRPLDDNDCPICRKPPLLVKPQDVVNTPL